MLLLVGPDDDGEALSDEERDDEALIGRGWAEHAQAGHVVVS